jgi:hypothetical protein
VCVAYRFVEFVVMALNRQVGVKSHDPRRFRFESSWGEQDQACSVNGQLVLRTDGQQNCPAAVYRNWR